MKSTKASQEKPKRSAEDWVEIAREFGEKCQVIQRNDKLDLDEKLKKQNALSQKLAKEIQDDDHLKKDEKKMMIESIHSYMADWTKMYDLIKKTAIKK